MGTFEIGENPFWIMIWPEAGGKEIECSGLNEMPP